jgi:hypothetical protein
MLETLITSLLVALISALAFIAYKHPAGYGKIYSPLLVTLTSIVVIFAVWDMAIMTARITIMDQVHVEGSPEITLDVRSQVTRAIESVRLSSRPWLIWLIWALAYAFLYFLFRLPSILADQNQDTKPKE